MYILLSLQKKNSEKFPGDFPTSFEITLKVCANGCYLSRTVEEFTMLLKISEEVSNIVLL